MIARVLLTCCLALVACTPSASTDTPQAPAVPEPGPGQGDKVVIKTFIFRPDPLTVEAGTTVTWINQDEILHSVSSGERVSRADGTEEILKDGMFDEPLDGVGAAFRFRFTEPGTYSYLCTIHPGMDAEVIVR